MILGVLVPDDLTRKTFRAIVDEAGGGEDGYPIKIGERSYGLRVMEDSYDSEYQISAPEGSIVAHGYLTYGYGETLPWEKVEQAKAELEEWLRGIAERHKCSYSIRLTANYW
jgi:hypothetical protein